MDYQELNNGLKIPVLGLGVFRMDDKKEAYKSIRKAIDLGYRHIDTAMIYENEEPVGKAIRESGVDRADFFVTTKLWIDDIKNDNAQNALDSSLRKLGLDYVDLYLVHWPIKDKYVSIWKDMERIAATDKVRAVGVSNYQENHLKEILDLRSLVPAVNQIELHPYLSQNELVEFCTQHNIKIESWSPLCANKNNLLDEQILKDLAEKYSKTPAQIILRWNIERGLIVIPKSSNPGRQKENINLFDFSLTAEDIEKVNSLNKDLRVGPHPDIVGFE
ncbi:MAG TPA: aldo/keto reductase [Dysgonamonadaceae bacterium]|nr:aldo/keto reductase [Dysgonamonadaceae bacterium]